MRSSYATTPNAQMSALWSTALPRACSGAMYAAVPRIIPSCVPCAAVSVGDCINVGERAMSAAEAGEPAAGAIAFANPKSRTLTFPSMEAFMF